MKEFIEELGMFVLRCLGSILFMLLYWPLSLVLSIITFVPQIIFARIVAHHICDKRYDKIIDGNNSFRDNMGNVAMNADSLSDAIGAGIMYSYILVSEEEDIDINYLRKYPFVMDIRNRFNAYCKVLLLIWDFEVEL